jgi:hypothetical protein
MAGGSIRISKCIATPNRGWAPWIASLTIFIVAWAPLLGAIHQAQVRHVVCEHGDLIEPDERGAHVSNHAPVVASNDGSRPSVSAGLGSVSHEHSHCSVGTLARNVATLDTSNSAGALLAEDRPVSLAARDADPVRSVLSSAPKTSPPGAASSLLL